MKIDSIVKEEFWRSIGAIYWISFFIIGILIMNDYLPVSLSYAFPLALIPTVAHFLVMVWYRRKEDLDDRNPASILRHALRLGEEGEENKKQRRVVVEKAVDAVLIVVILLIYLYASLASSISQAFWLPVLVVIGILLARIAFIDGGERRITLARSAAFYVIASTILLLRYLVLGYPALPLLQAIMFVGIASFPVLYLWSGGVHREGWADDRLTISGSMRHPVGFVNYPARPWFLARGA